MQAVMDETGLSFEQLTSWGNSATKEINDARGIFYTISRETLKRVWKDIAEYVGKTWKAIHVAHGRSKAERAKREDVRELLSRVEIRLGIKEVK